MTTTTWRRVAAPYSDPYVCSYSEMRGKDRVRDTVTGGGLIVATPQAVNVTLTVTGRAISTRQQWRAFTKRMMTRIKQAASPEARARLADAYEAAVAAWDDHLAMKGRKQARASLRLAGQRFEIVESRLDESRLAEAAA